MNIDDKEMFPLTFRIINPETLLSTVCAVHEFTALPGTCRDTISYNGQFDVGTGINNSFGV